MTREDLYELVWSLPGKNAAIKLSVSDVYLGRICIALNIPRPPRGYWAKLAAGKETSRPPLPPASPLRPTAWLRATGTAKENLAPLYRLTSKSEGSFERLAARHTREAFAHATPDAVGYLKPLRKNTLDITVTTSTLERAIEVFEDLISSLDKRGHKTLIASASGTAVRKSIDPRYPESGQHPLPKPTWRTMSPTVAEIAGTAIGMAIVEPCILTNMRYVGDGKFMPEKPGLNQRVVGHSWTQAMWIPTGTLKLIAYVAFTSSDRRISWTEIEEASCLVGLEPIIDKLEQFALPSSLPSQV